ncbi:hypothetical protein TWF718_009696 [Orbilia javanica]|uniref:Uncharacterized protein n=1 Tax=Orbilia javanica TaxID=47235 RepID=A0AAN8MU47_9PEZI
MLPASFWVIQDQSGSLRYHEPSSSQIVTRRSPPTPLSPCRKARGTENNTPEPSPKHDFALDSFSSSSTEDLNYIRSSKPSMRAAAAILSSVQNSAAPLVATNLATGGPLNSTQGADTKYSFGPLLSESFNSTVTGDSSREASRQPSTPPRDIITSSRVREESDYIANTPSTPDEEANSDKVKPLEFPRPASPLEEDDARCNGAKEECIFCASISEGSGSPQGPTEAGLLERIGERAKEGDEASGDANTVDASDKSQAPSGPSSTPCSAPSPRSRKNTPGKTSKLRTHSLDGSLVDELADICPPPTKKDLRVGRSIDPEFQDDLVAISLDGVRNLTIEHSS